ncbi:unnamed protein product [Pleuronectes platessa]|uniref:Uncharacterized protein n=1 Tax=Pleuronectes platessa TaxID=8262 RepID=A0A9N7VRM9_PLEPL|nr:unnamed protein product [Pleuronectes platessa]
MNLRRKEPGGRRSPEHREEPYPASPSPIVPLEDLLSPPPPLYSSSSSSSSCYYSPEQVSGEGAWEQQPTAGTIQDTVREEAASAPAGASLKTEPLLNGIWTPHCKPPHPNGVQLPPVSSWSRADEACWFRTPLTVTVLPGGGSPVGKALGSVQADAWSLRTGPSRPPGAAACNQSRAEA